MLQVFRVILFVVLLGLLGTDMSYGQIAPTNVAPNNSPQHLVENVLVGPGVTTFNWTFAGNAAQLGFFSNGGTTINVDSGIVMSTGNIAQISNNVAGITTTGYNGPGDADLTAVAASINPGITITRDRAVLEFDFVAPTDTVTFDYVFASEEWPNYIGSVFNDAFGFFVSGPGITGTFTVNAINVANVPGTTTPITISTIHPGLNSQYYNLNSNTPPFAFFAYTDVFTTSPMVVNPCDTFHMKLAIADGTDDAFDSAVFLKARSFKGKNIVLTASPTYTNFGNDSTLYEQCGGAQLNFERLANISGTDTIRFQISGTATNGDDYTALPDSIVFTPGQTLANISFNVLPDTLIEGLETLIITVLPDSSTILCNNDTTELILYLADVPPLDFQLTDDTIINCTSAPIDLVIDSLEGLLPPTYLWSTSDTDSVVTVLPSLTTTYYVTVTDACQADTLTDSVTVAVLTPPFVTQTTPDTIDCTDTATIGVAITMNYLPGIQFQWSTGDIDSIITVAPDTTTSYLVSTTLPCSWQLIVDTVVVVVDNPPFVTAPINNFDTIN
ncbi:MAG: choice-of-anchor L domain-containing protein [Salibacteraceae bacterium]